MMEQIMSPSPPATFSRFFLCENGWLWDRTNLDSAVMTDSEAEARSYQPLWENARGDVLIAGLGIGFCLPKLLVNENVASITVLEKHKEVINLVPVDPRVELINQDAFTYETNRKFDTIWSDIWNGEDEDQDQAELHHYLLQFLAPDGWAGDFQWL